MVNEKGAITRKVKILEEVLNSTMPPTNLAVALINIIDTNIPE